MPSGKLYTYPNNFRAYKALIAAQYSGVKVEVAKDFVFGETNKQEAFLKKFPFGKVPAYEDTDGTCVFESNAIAWHVANDQLRGRGASRDAAAQVLQWMSHADTELLPAVAGWTFPLQGILAVNNTTRPAMIRARQDLAASLHALNAFLLTRTFLAGERLTLADIVVCCTLLPAYQLAMDPEFRRPFGNVNRWFNTLVNQPQVKAVIGAVKLCDKACEVTAQAASKPAAAAAAKDSKKNDAKKTTPKQQPKSKKAEKKEPEVAADAADEALAAEPKSKDPFVGLPKSSWDMDDFKRFYSNNDEDKSVPYFWQHFDKENYSIWRCDYKFPEDLKMVFMSCNLVAGMFQRLEKLRKSAFASMLIFGKDGDMSISGIWVWRGHDLVFELSPDWQIDYESYKWTKLDAGHQDTRKMVDAYFKWEGSDAAGRAINQGKIYK